MVGERKGLLALGGKDVTILGMDVNLGEKAQGFMVTDQNWEPVDPLALYTGKVKIIAAVPSLETSVCDREVRRFNQDASNLDERVVVITVSMDLPYTQARWCGNAGIDRVYVVSDHHLADFGQKYGCLVKERRILRRAVFVVDGHDMVVYSEYMKALGDEPDYAAVLQAAERALRSDD